MSIASNPPSGSSSPSASGSPSPTIPAVSLDWAGRVAETADLRVSYVRTGQGTPVVFLHGWPEWKQVWMHNLPALAGEFDMLTLDANMAWAPTDAPEPHDPPGYLGALLHGALGVKGSHSVLPDLIRIRELNLRIAEIGAIADLQNVPVNDAVQKAWLEAGTPDKTRSSTDSPE